MSGLTRGIAGACLALGISAGAHASTDIVVPLVDVLSNDLQGDPDNFDILVNLATAAGLPSGSAVTVVGIGWDVEISADTPSWLSEAVIGFGDPNGVLFTVALTPGIGDDFPGTETYSSGGVVDLVGLGLDFGCTQGVLSLEFFESFDDYPDDWDAFWNGNITVRIAEMGTVIPLPTTASLGLAGLGVLAGIRRRR